MGGGGKSTLLKPGKTLANPVKLYVIPGFSPPAWGWSAHNSTHFLEAPPGGIRNFAETVLGPRPDLVVSEFVNDCALDAGLVESNYQEFFTDFQRLGAEWVILTPHYNSFMNLTTERDLDDDPRPCVKILRRFAPEHNVALADAARRYGRLWRQGIPFSTLMVNTCNHPGIRGMAIFADSLMALFPCWAGPERLTLAAGSKNIPCEQTH